MYENFTENWDLKTGCKTQKEKEKEKKKSIILKLFLIVWKKIVIWLKELSQLQKWLLNKILGYFELCYLM